MRHDKGTRADCQTATATASPSRPPSALKRGLDLLKLGFWVVAIHPSKKRPIGKGWGLERWDEGRLRSAFEQYPDAGIGICLGPGRAPHGGDVIDLEGDGDEAEESLRTLLGGEIPETTAWSSRRGEHNLFIVDLDRLQRVLVAAGAVEGTDEKGKGAWHLPELPGLEFRTGGKKADGTAKQIQSVVPPTPGDDGEPRRWTSSPKGGVADLPESVYAFLEQLGATRKQAEPKPAAKRGPRKTSSDVRNGYAQAALDKECDAIESATEGNRNNRLNVAAFSLGQLIGAQVLDQVGTEQALMESARRAGLGQAESIATIRSGIDAGMLKPRDLNGIGQGPPPPSPPPDGDGDDESQDSALAKMPRTDYGNAERLVARHGNKLRYCHPWGKWLRYDGRRWKIDDIGAVHRLAKSAARKVLMEASTIDDEEKRKAHVAWGFISESRAKIESMLAMATSEEGIPILPEDLDGDVWLFNCPNGTVDLKTGLLRGHRREDNITQLCPVTFDPSARCPLWDDTLHLFFGGDTELIDYVQRLCGYALVGVIRDHIMPIAYGKGSNGKSTILGTLLETFGPDYAMKCPPDMLMAKKNDSHPTERTDLFRKRLVVAIESDTGRRLNETMVKELTGGDRIRARRMREDNWEFKPTHTLMMATNHKPTIRGSDLGIWRRLKLIPFTVSVEGAKDDKSMPEKLLKELPGILAWCVRGCLKWQEKGLDEPEKVKEATKQYRLEQDVLASFLEEHTLQGPNYRVKCGELYARYKQEAEKGNEDVLSLTAFGESMRERGFETKRSNGKWYLGVALRDIQSD
jgi:P4 family phage/plasmid primase-like protien